MFIFRWFAFHPGRARDPNPISALRIQQPTWARRNDVAVITGYDQTALVFQKKVRLLNVLQGFPETTDYEAEYYTRGGGISLAAFKETRGGSYVRVLPRPRSQMLARGNYDSVAQ